MRIFSDSSQVNLVSKDNITPLYICAHTNNLACFKYLLANGGNPSISDFMDVSPLHLGILALLFLGDTMI